MSEKTKQQILNLASDLRRIAWWASDPKIDRSNLINKFINSVESQFSNSKIGENNKILDRNLISGWLLVKKGLKNKLVWAEEILTVSLRLQHRSNLM